MIVQREIDNKQKLGAILTKFSYTFLDAKFRSSSLMGKVEKATSKWRLIQIFEERYVFRYYYWKSIAPNEST